MAYKNNQYDYQIAVIFAILIGGCLFLAIVIAGIYFMCVNTMRDDDKKRLNSGRNSASHWQPAPQSGPELTSYIPPSSAQPNYDYNTGPIARTPVNQSAAYTPIPSAQYNPGAQYSNVPLATPTTQQYITTQNIPQYQPDVTFNQGPTSYIQQQAPMDYSMSVTPNAANYHQSSV